MFFFLSVVRAVCRFSLFLSTNSLSLSRSLPLSFSLPSVIVSRTQLGGFRLPEEPQRLEVVVEHGRAQQTRQVRFRHAQLPASAPGQGSQISNHLWVLGFHGLEHGGGPPAVFDRRIGLSLLDEHLDEVELAVRRGDVQRASSVVVS